MCLQSCVLVQRRTREHVIHVSQHGCTPELGSIKQGDRVWWLWTGDDSDAHGFTVHEDLSINTGLKNASPSKTADCSCEQSDLCQAVGRVGLITVKPQTPGLLTYRLKPTGNWAPKEDIVFSIIVQSAEQEHVVHVSDKDFKPHIINVHPGDSVTWLWEDTDKLHNIQQASHQQTIIEDGFHGNRPSPSPEAFRHMFTDLGVFYFTSCGLPSLCGAVVVTAEHQVHKVEVSLHGMDPDPLGVTMGDCVCWMWCSGELYSICQISSPDDIDKVSGNQAIPDRRRCFARHFTKTGLFHFACTAFVQDEVEPNLHASDTFINSVLVDPLPYSSRVRVSRDGFQPANVVIAKYQSVLWTWEDAVEDRHNILHVKGPEQVALRVPGTAAFGSGPVTEANSFFHTFDTSGSYWVASEGAGGSYCRVDVLEDEKRVLPPRIAEGTEGGTVEPGFTVFLTCKDSDVTILYTLDGSRPQQGEQQVYDWTNGIRLDRPGLYIIRCMAVTDGWIPSDIFTSRRIWVLEENVTVDNVKEAEDEGLSLRQEITNWQWSSCVPFISYGFMFDNVIHLDLALPKTSQLSWIAGFKLYLNGAVQGGWICASCARLEVSGLCGGKKYHVILAVFPVNENFKPQISNELIVECPAVSSFGGPVVSLETCGRRDALIVVWPAFPDTRFLVMIDGQPFGEEIDPEPEADYCRVLFESSDEGHLYTLCIVMCTQGSDDRLLSNELQFRLPLPEELVHRSTPIMLQDDSKLLAEASPNQEQDAKELIVVAEVESFGPNKTAEDEPRGVLSDSSIGKLDAIPEHKQLDVVYTPPPSLELHQEHLGANDNVMVSDGQQYDSNAITDHHGSNVGDDHHGPGVETDYGNGVVTAGQLEETPVYDSPLRKDKEEPLDVTNDNREPQLCSNVDNPQQRGPNKDSSDNSVEMNGNIIEQDESKEISLDNNAVEDALADHEDVESERDQLNNNDGQESEVAWSSSHLEDGFNAVVAQSLFHYNCIDEPDVPTERCTADLVEESIFENVYSEAVLVSQALIIDGDKTTGELPIVRPGKHIEPQVMECVLSEEKEKTSLPNNNQSNCLSDEISRTEEQGAIKTVKALSDSTAEGKSTKDSAAENTSLDIIKEVNPIDGDDIIYTTTGENSLYVLDKWHEHHVKAIGWPRIEANVSSVVTQEQDDQRNEATSKGELAEENTKGQNEENEMNDMEHHNHLLHLTPQLSNDTVVFEADTISDGTKRNDDNRDSTDGQSTPSSESSEDDHRPLSSHLLDLSTSPTSLVSDVMQAVPSPDVHLVVKGSSNDKVVLEWEYKPSAVSLLQSFSLLVVGRKFNATIDSHRRIPFEESSSQNMWPSIRRRFEQHCWMTTDRLIEIQGLKQRLSYRVAVLVTSPQINLMSNVLVYTLPGRPKTPAIHVTALRDQEATISWRPVCAFGDATIVGYRVLINGSHHEDMLPHHAVHYTLTNIQQGTNHKVSVIAVTNHSVGDSAPSREVTIVCPHPPPAPDISEIPSSTCGTVAIAWLPIDSPQSSLSSYAVFVDGELHGSCPADDVSDIFMDEFLYTISGLESGREYEVCIRGHVDPQMVEQSVHMCGCYGPPSNVLKVYCTCAPSPPLLTILSMDTAGVNLAWEKPQEYGAATITGYLLCINDRFHGNILDPDCQQTSIPSLPLGQSTTVTLTAGTGDITNRNLVDHDFTQRVHEAVDSGVESSSSYSVDNWSRTELGLCSISPPLVLHMWGFVQGIRDVIIRQTSCCSVMVNWTDAYAEDEKTGQEHPLVVKPDGYTVTWWRSEGEKTLQLGTLQTPDSYVQLDDLRPPTTHGVLVEAFAKHPNDQNALDPSTGLNKARAEQKWFDVEPPPEPPANLNVVSSTDSTICLAWDKPEAIQPPISHICLTAATRHDSEDIPSPAKAFMQFVLTPSTTTYTIKNLQAKTQYVFTLAAVVGNECPSAAKQNTCGKTRSLVAWTSGVDAPCGVSVSKRTPFSLHLTWEPAVTYGDLCIKHYTIHCAEKKRRWSPHGIAPPPMEGQPTGIPQRSVIGVQGEISGLEPGLLYRIVIEAVVGCREQLDEEESALVDEASSVASSEADWVVAVGESCLSEPLLARTSSPPGKPALMLAGLTATQIQLAWDAPSVLYLDPESKEHAERYDYRGSTRAIRSYTIEVNGRNVAKLTPNKSSYTVKRCKPGMKYTCYLKVTTTSAKSGGKRSKNDKIATAVSTASLDTDDEEESGSCYPEEVSSPLEVTIPRLEHPLTISVYYTPTCSTALSQSSRATSSTVEAPACQLKEGDDGCIVVMWNSSVPARSMSSYQVMWSSGEREDQEEYLSPSSASFEIHPVTKRSLYTIRLKLIRLDGTSYTYGPFHCQIPGRPESPWIWCRAVSEYRIQVEWNEPRTCGQAYVDAYQVNLNGRQLGKLLSPQSRKVAVHCQPSSVYRIRLLALTADPSIGGSQPSNLLTICTPGSPKKSLVQHMQLRPLWTGNECIAVEWDAVDDDVDHYVVKWSSVLSPQPQEEVVPAEETSLVIDDCMVGTRHFIAVAAIDCRGKLVSKSTQLIVQTSAPLPQPLVRLRSALPAAIVIEWDQPMHVGDATVQAYEIKVDSVVHCTLDNSQFVYEFLDCLPCRQYAFQVRATSSKAGCDGDWSDPLVVTCPGARAPVLSRVQSSHVNCIHVGWEVPMLAGGATVNHYKVHYVEDEGVQAQNALAILEATNTITHGPLHPPVLDNTLHDVTSAYWVALEVVLDPRGCQAVFSEPIRLRAAVPPAAPIISVDVRGLVERKTLEGLVCHMIQTRDRLCRKIELLQNSVTVLGAKQKQDEITKIVATLRNVEQELTRGVGDIRQRTGSISCRVRWGKSRDDGDAIVTGYQVYVDQYPHGKLLDYDTLIADVQLSPTPATHVLFVKSLSSHPVGPSAPSNAVSVCAKDFMPFVMFCYFGVHSKEARWPALGSCSYEDALNHEVKKHLNVKHRGPLEKPLPTPVCKVMDVVTSSWKPLLDSSVTKATAVMFWTKWCQSSLEGLQMFDQFAYSASNQFGFISCCVQSSEGISDHHQSLRVMLASRGLLGQNSNVRHVCGCHPQSPLCRSGTGGRGHETEVTHVFGLVGVPTLLICNQSGYMAWQGRICARDYADYAQQMQHVFCVATAQACPVRGCVQCVLDHEMDITLDKTRDAPTPYDLSLRDRSTDDMDCLHRRLHESHASPLSSPIIRKRPAPKPYGSQNPTNLRTESCSRQQTASRCAPSPAVPQSVVSQPIVSQPIVSNARGSVFHNRFSNVLDASLPSLRLNASRIGESGYRPATSKSKKRISVEEFTP